MQRAGGGRMQRAGGGRMQRAGGGRVVGGCRWRMQSVDTLGFETSAASAISVRPSPPPNSALHLRPSPPPFTSAGGQGVEPPC
jgi:hypothetical protein